MYSPSSPTSPAETTPASSEKKQKRPVTPQRHQFVISTPISPKLHLLRPIEALVRYRETHGYAVIEEMIHITKKVIKAPSPNRCLVVLGGPDALALPMCEAGILFLCDTLGFHCDIESGSSTVAAVNSNDRKGAGSGKFSPAVSSMITQGGGAFLQLMRDYDLDSADWKLFQKRGQGVLRELEWAANCNSSEITIKLHTLIVTKQPFSAPIRVEVAVDWRDELGNEMSQIFSNTNGSAGAGPNDGSGAGGGSASDQTPNSGANGETTTYLDHHKSVCEQTQGTNIQSFTYPLMMVLSTKCDAPSCSVNIKVYRKRAVVSDKLKAKSYYHYQHLRPARDKILLKDPDNENITVGSLMCEASSLSQIFAENEAQEQAEEEARRSASKTEGDREHSAEAVLDDKPHVPFIEHVEKGPADEGVKYDADDYF